MERPRRIAARIESTLGIHPGELRLALLLSLQCHVLVGAFVVGRSVRDTLFLARVSPSALPWVYILASAAVAAAGFSYARLAAHRRLDIMLPATALLFAGTYVAARLALPVGGGWLPSALYAWVEVTGSITLIQFWSFASVLCDSRRARRLFGIVALGGTVAAVAAGFAVGGLARRGGTPALLWLTAGYLVAAAGLADLAVRAAGPRTWSAPPLLRPARPERPSAPDDHLRALALLTALTFLTVTFVDYQFKAAAAARFGRDPRELARFFGLFAGATGLAGLGLQLGLVGRILQRSGVAVTLSLLPTVLGLCSAAAAVLGGFWTALFTKSAEQTLRYTASDSATQLLYVPLAALRRARSKALVDGVVRPAAVAAAGVVLLLLPPGAPGARRLAVVTLLLSALWLLALWIVHRRHLDALRDALRRGRLDLGVAPRRFAREAARAVRRALASGDSAEVEGALWLAPRVPAELSTAIAALLGHPSPRIRALACEALARDPSAAGEVARLLGDPEPEVRAAAAAATLRLGGEAAGAAREVVEGLAGSGRPGDRLLAARALGGAGAGAPQRLLAELLSDPDPAIRRAALAAAGEARIPALLPALVFRLGRRDTARAASEALSAWGPGAEPALASVLADPRQDPALRRRAAAPLGRIATGEAVEILLRHVDAEDEAQRTSVDEALAHAARRRPGVALDHARLRRVQRVELALAWRAVAAAEALSLPDGAGSPPARRDEAARHLLAAALREKVGRAADRALLLAAVLQPDADIDVARARLSDGSPERRSAALELLDTVLDGSVRQLLVPLLDERPRAERLREAEGIAPQPRLSAEEWLAELLCDESPWVVAATCHASGALEIRGAARGLRRLLAHHVPWVREAALAALARLLPPTELAGAALELATDPFEPVRCQALALAGPPHAAVLPEAQA
jgi:ATP/ADP translocase/HEAT repeat protein